MSGPVDELERNAVETLPRGDLASKLAVAEREGRSLRVKLGIDPTAPDIHLGHTVVLSKLRQFQDLGHLVVLIVGDYTARIGDPSGRSKTRPTLRADEIDANAATFQEQAFKVLDRERVELRRNSEWLDMSMEELFRLLRIPTVAQMLERDDFAKRYAAGSPIALLELLYPVLQGYDSVAVRSDVELGGTDQKFNLLVGRQLQEAFGQVPQAVMTLPILPGTDGRQRMGKSLGNHIGVTEAPQEMFGKVMRVPDEAMALYYELLLGHEPSTVDPPVEQKRLLAREIVARFHGSPTDPAVGGSVAAAAEARFDRIHKEHGIPEDVPTLVIDSAAIVDPGRSIHMPALIAAAFGETRSAGRRLLQQGGVQLDGRQLGAGDLDVPADELDGAILRAGKRRFVRLKAPPSER